MGRREKKKDQRQKDRSATKRKEMEEKRGVKRKKGKETERED